VQDPDTVSLSNLNRQVLYTPADVGLPKASVAAQRLQALNPDAHIEAVFDAFTTENAAVGLQGVQLVLDASDNFATRYAADDACAAAHLPLVMGALYQWEGQVAVFHTLAGGGARVRYRHWFPSPPPNAPTCATGGVLGPLAGVVGSLMATEALKLLAGVGQPLVGRLLVLDALTLRTRILKMPSLGALATLATPPTTAQPTPNAMCAPAPALPQAGAEARRVLDVREPDEALAHPLPLAGLVAIPFGELLGNLHLLDAATPWRVVCASGARAQVAARLLRQHGYDATHAALADA
jgi:adenylyltransferase/sulfurtransferase